MRALLTGQIGLDKKAFVAHTAAIARSHGEDLQIYNIGDMMYAEAPDVRPGRILDLPLARLNALRRSVFRDVLADMPNHKNVLVNTHATFRWKHGLFSAFDFDQLALFDADLYVTLVDNIETVHQRMLKDHDLEHSLKDLMVWREEEILATEILARSIRRSTAVGGGDTPPSAPGGGSTQHSSARFFVLSRGRTKPTAETLFRLIFRPNMKTVYPSFPMSHVMDLPDTLAEIDDFRAKIADKMIAFDPGDVDEKVLSDLAIRAASTGKQTLTIFPGDPIKTAHTNFGDLQNAPALAPSLATAAAPLQLKVADLLQIVPDIDGQIYARDFMLVRQSDMIVSYIPELPGPDGKPGKPGLSSGVERELQHAHEHAKDVYVIWKPKKEPSPFITQTANKVFRSVDEAFAYFDQKGYFQPHSLFGS
ncbi:MAG TPA: AAA family ATPase [Phycisphaerae bacterium]|nr:AAA family ATPase [Phycisphaerae bacterium]